MSPASKLMPNLSVFAGPGLRGEAFSLFVRVTWS